MTRETILLEKREDLKKCIQTRKSLLLELYRSASVHWNITKQSSDASRLFDIDLAGEQAFLAANDISIGRYFNASTLDPPLSRFRLSSVIRTRNEPNVPVSNEPLPPTKEVEGQAIKSVQTSGEKGSSLPSTSFSDSAVVPPGKSGQSSEGPDHDISLENGIDPVERGAVRTPGAAGTAEPYATTELSNAQLARPIDVLPLLTEDAGRLPDSVSKKLETEDRPNGARSIHLPSKEKPEGYVPNLDSNKSIEDGQPSSSPKPDEDHVTQSHTPQDTSHSSSKINVPQATTPNISYASSQVHSEGILESQMAIARLDAVTGGSSFTADEQLRFEEARSLQGQALDSDVGISPKQKPDVAIHGDTFATLDEVGRDKEIASQSSDLQIKPFRKFGREQQQTDSASEPSGLRHFAYSGIATDTAKDITFSQRPPMRIDTEVEPDLTKAASLRKAPGSSATTVHTPPDSASSARVSQGPTQPQSPPERMTTRVSSGALRHKSVSEILGETPKTAAPHPDKTPSERVAADANRGVSLPGPRSSISVTTPDPTTFRLRLSELKDRDRSKLSTVVFARKQQLQSSRRSERSHSWDANSTTISPRNTEYFLPLFQAQSASPPRAQFLSRLIGSASKTLTTANHHVDHHEQRDCRILSRIEQLQKCNRWSLRQLQRTAEPERPAVHWDVLLSQMKWLRTDFREERKWKTAAASSIATWCAAWVTSSREGRLALQIKTRPSRSMVAAAPESTPTPDLIPSAEDDFSDAPEDEIDHVDVFSGKAPAAIFSMIPEMFYFGLEKSRSAEKLLQELPLYQPSVEIQQAALGQMNVTLDKDWKPALLPVSKYAEGKIVSHDEGPPRKKSRYEYADLDEDCDPLLTDVPTSGGSTPGPRPEQEDVALFNPENKHIRDRIHAGHAFRPPSEHVMPSQSFFESRQSSQWTHAEDDELRRLVREYAYNWSLISSCLSFPSVFSSGAERRTPWECFERWIGLEGLPAEMAKTQYFRAYHQRLQAAQTTYEAQQQALQQQQGTNTPLRRRSTQPFWVERRRNMKHVHLVNAMKNLARKREATMKKPEKVDGVAIRKAASAVQPRHAMQTPQEFSRLRHEREMKMQEQAKVYRMQMIQQQKVHAAQRSVLQSGQHPASTSLTQPGRNVIPAIPNGNGVANLLPNGQTQQSLGSQPRPSSMSRHANAVQTNGSFLPQQQGIPHAPMQPAHMPGATRLPPQMSSDNMRVLQEASRVQVEQQRFLQQQRQQQQQPHPQMNGQSSPNLGSSAFMPANGSSSHASFQRRSGSPSVNGGPTPNGSSSSPRMTNLSQPQALSSGMMPTINQIMSQLRACNPTATQEQISQMATDRLKQYHVTHSHAHAAMQAAAGGGVSANGMNGSAMGSLQGQQQPPTAMMNTNPLTTTQQYAQMIRNQQQHQQNRNSGTPYSGPQASSRGATPQIHRTPSAQGSHPSPNLVPSQAQVAGGQ
ncbi:MAG: hypothetical protein Q9219_000080 [cf. Caloplaca sp. 3 TL-2023]